MIPFEKILEIYNKTHSIKKASEQLGVSVQNISHRLKKMGKYHKEWSRPKNEVIENNNFLVLVTNRNEFIVIDKEDYNKIKDSKWCVSKTGYAVANINKKVVKMHRQILGVIDPSQIIDHKNRNKLDNRKENLRICSQKENTRNRGATRGRELPLGIRKRNGKFEARIMVNRKEINLGGYACLSDAVLARKEGEKKYFGGFRYC